MSTLEDALRKVPPQSLEAEESVLGGILLDSHALDRVIEVMGPDDFYRETNRKIFLTMLALTERGEPIDLITLTDSLKTRNELQEIGGATYLAELIDKVPSAANIAYYARIVREKAVLRNLITVSGEIVSRAYTGQEDIERFLDEAERLIFDVSEQRIRPAFSKVGDMIMDTIKAIEQLYERKELVTGVPTGFPDLDQKTAGFQPADLVIIAARPSMGKTAFVLNIAQYVAMQTQTAVGIFSLEMAKEQLVMRMLCAEARVDNAKVRAGYLAERDFPRLAMAAGRLAEAPIYIDDTPGQNVLELRAKARRLKREANLGLIIIDYLQLMRGLTAQENRTQELAEISRSLKALAKELDIPVVALSQLNRQVELRADKRPVMSDIRESGSIEQDADVIMFIYRDEVYHAESEEEGTAEIIIGKQRNGPTGMVRLAWRSEYTRFDNLVDTFAEPEEALVEAGLGLDCPSGHRRGCRGRALRGDDGHLGGKQGDCRQDLGDEQGDCRRIHRHQPSWHCYQQSGEEGRGHRHDQGRPRDGHRQSEGPSQGCG